MGNEKVRSRILEDEEEEEEEEEQAKEYAEGQALTKVTTVCTETLATFYLVAFVGFLSGILALINFRCAVKVFFKTSLYTFW